MGFSCPRGPRLRTGVADNVFASLGHFRINLTPWSGGGHEVMMESGLDFTFRCLPSLALREGFLPSIHCSIRISLCTSCTDDNAADTRGRNYEIPSKQAVGASRTGVKSMM